MDQVTLRGIHKRYGDLPVIRGVDLAVRDGEFLVFVGPSGSGKSTTLRMIAGLESITEGGLLIDGQRANDLRPADRGADMVFQSCALYPHMAVAENTGFALRMAGVGKAQRAAQVGRAAETLRTRALLGRFPKHLSCGRRRRVAIGRAIARQPKVCLFDQPLSNLDAALRVNMRIAQSRLHKELGTTMDFATHDRVEAVTMGDRIAVFNQGRVEQLVAPRINLIDRPASAAPAPHQALWGQLSGPAPAAAQHVGLRPERLGDSSILHLQVAGVADLLNAKVGAGQIDLDTGAEVGLLPDPARALAFDAAGRLLV